MTTKKTIAEFSVSVEADHEQYWRGHGISYTSFDECTTGSGCTIREAFEDALDSLAQNGVEVSDEQQAAMLAELSDGLKCSLDDDIVVLYCDDAGNHETECSTCEGSGKVNIEPEDDDLTSSDGLKWFQSGKLVLTLTEDDDRDTALQAYCDREQFWPNKWIISDHGNAVCLGSETGNCETECSACDGTGKLKDDAPDCAVCAGEWYFYVSIDVKWA